MSGAGGSARHPEGVIVHGSDSVAAMGTAIVWGALAASSLVIGACSGSRGRWPERWVGLVLAFGAVRSISAVSFELAEEGGEVGGGGGGGGGLAVGAFTYWALERAGYECPSERRRSAGTALALGASSTGSPSSSSWASASPPAAR